MQDRELMQQEPVAHLWECLGRWSAYLASNGRQADLAPPQWLCDAINAATTPPARKPLTITEESAWNLACYVYAKSNPHESPQILLSAMEIKQIIEAFLKEKNQ